jgi:hypothetical protein
MITRKSKRRTCPHHGIIAWRKLHREANMPEPSTCLRRSPDRHRGAEDRTDPPAPALLARIKAHIRHHLADPELSPETVTHAHRIIGALPAPALRGAGRHARAVDPAALPGGVPPRADRLRALGEAPTIAAVAHQRASPTPAHFSRGVPCPVRRPAQRRTAVIDCFTASRARPAVAQLCPRARSSPCPNGPTRS